MFLLLWKDVGSHGNCPWLVRSPFILRQHEYCAVHKRIPEDIRKQSRKISYNTPQIAILFQMKPKKNKISSKEEISFVQKQALMKSSIYVSARNMWKLMLTSRRHTNASFMVLTYICPRPPLPLFWQLMKFPVIQVVSLVSLSESSRFPSFHISHWYF